MTGSASTSSAFFAKLLVQNGLQVLSAVMAEKGWTAVRSFCMAGGWFPGCGSNADGVLKSLYLAVMGDKVSPQQHADLRHVLALGHELLKQERKRRSQGMLLGSYVAGAAGQKVGRAEIHAVHSWHAKQNVPGGSAQDPQGQHVRRPPVLESRI